MAELREGAGYQATYGPNHTLTLTQERDSIKVAVVDRSQGNIFGRLDGHATTMDEAKRLAIDLANEQLGRNAPADPPSWIYFNPPLPAALP